MNFPELTDAQVNSICLSYRHDFGLEKLLFSCGMTDNEREQLRHLVKEIYYAISKEFTVKDILKNIPSDELLNELRLRLGEITH